jgi:hypothetical protein
VGGEKELHFAAHAKNAWPPVLRSTRKTVLTLSPQMQSDEEAYFKQQKAVTPKRISRQFERH